MPVLRIDCSGELYEIWGKRAELTGHNKSSWFRAVWASGWRPNVLQRREASHQHVFEQGPDGAVRRREIVREATKGSITMPADMIREVQTYKVQAPAELSGILAAMIMYAPDPAPPKKEELHSADDDCERRTEIFAIRLHPREVAEIKKRAEKTWRKPSDWARAVILRELDRGED